MATKTQDKKYYSKKRNERKVEREKDDITKRGKQKKGTKRRKG